MHYGQIKDAVECGWGLFCFFFKIHPTLVNMTFTVCNMTMPKCKPQNIMLGTARKS